MNKKENLKKGFTLIELLAVIVILAIIALIAIPLILDYINKARDGVFSTNLDMVESATRNYVVLNYDVLPSNEGEISTVSLEKLISEGYVKNVVDPKNQRNNCEGYVNITMVSKNDYDFKPYLKCSNNYVSDDYGMVLVSIKNYGGTLYDTHLDIISLDEYLITIGNSYSSDNDLAGLNKGDSDAIIVKYDKEGNIIWNKNFGGSLLDRFYRIVAVEDGFIAVGHSNSNDNDLAGLNKGGQDAIIVKYDFNGNLVWSKNYGGSNNDYFRGVAVLEDGIIAIGYSASDDGDLIGLNKGGQDGLVVKYDFSGNLIWSKTYGGTATDYFYNVQAIGNGFVVAGYSNSVNGDLQDMNKGSNDGIVVRYDSDGNIVWNKNFGGTNSEVFRNITVTNDSILIVGNSDSNNLDLAGLQKGGTDGILVKYDYNGNLIWTRVIGGSNSELAKSVSAINGGYLVLGNGNSNNLDFENLNRGGYDLYVAMYDTFGNKIWNQNIGGSEMDGTDSGFAIIENRIYLTGGCYSNDYDLENLNKGDSDACLVEISIK